MACVLDVAVSVPSTCSNCWPNPCARHTENLRPRPETTVVSLALRQSSNDWIITRQKIITGGTTHMENMAVKRCPAFMFLQPSSGCWKKTDSTFIEVLLYTCSRMDTPISFFPSEWHQLLETFFPSKRGSCFGELAEHRVNGAHPSRHCGVLSFVDFPNC